MKRRSFLKLPALLAGVAGAAQAAPKSVVILKPRSIGISTAVCSGCLPETWSKKLLTKWFNEHYSLGAQKK